MVREAHSPRPDDSRLSAAENDRADSSLAETAEACFRAAAAASRSSLQTATFEIAGRALRLEAGDELIMKRLARAFAHLGSATAADPTLTVSAWQGTPKPPLPLIENDAGARGAVVHFDDGRAHALYQPAIGSLSVLDVARSLGSFWADNAGALPEWECATPLRHILHWWLAAHGVQQVHAASVGNASGGVLVVGKGGSGKSTTALACATAGMAYAGDDYVGAAVDEPYVHSLYSSAKIEPHHLDRFPQLREARGTVRPDADIVAPFDYEKTILYVHELYPSVTVAGYPLRAILVARITDRRTPRLVPVSGPTALAALAPSTIVQLHTAGKDALESMARLVTEVPSYTLELGADIDAIPDVVSELLADLAPDGQATR
jgi:hypothetical protein